MKLPFISRKKHERIIEKKDNAYRYTVKEMQRDYDYLVEPLERICGKLSKVQLAPDPKGFSFRLAMDFDSRLIEQMVHGNDQRLIHEIGRMMGRRVEQEMRTLNFARFENIPW